MIVCEQHKLYFCTVIICTQDIQTLAWLTHTRRIRPSICKDREQYNPHDSINETWIHSNWQYRYSYDIPPIQCNVSYPNMLGLNPVRNYEYSVSLKLKYSAHNTFVLGSYRRHSQRKQGHKWRRDDDRTAKLEKAKPPTIKRGKIHTCRAVFSCNWRHGMCELIRIQ